MIIQYGIILKLIKSVQNDYCIELLSELGMMGFYESYISGLEGGALNERRHSPTV